MARRALQFMVGVVIGWCVVLALSLNTGCAHAGQIHTRAAAMPAFDRDSLDCNAPGLPRFSPGSLMSWIYRQNGALVQYDSIGIVPVGPKVSFPSIWLPSGRYYEDFAARDSGGVSCPVRRWFTIRGVPQSPAPDPVAPGER